MMKFELNEALARYEYLTLPPCRGGEGGVIDNYPSKYC